MLEWIKEYKFHISVGLLVVISLIYYFFSAESKPIFDNTSIEENWEQSTPEFAIEDRQKDTEEIVEEDILVDVKGAVKNPGVYYARSGDRVVDVIEEAGGLMTEAEDTAINFAMRVKDEMVIYIPKEGEDMEINEEILIPPQQTGKGKINLNGADQSELETLPGIGPAKAAAILEYRETNGPFKMIEDLMLVNGFGEKSFEKLREKITVN